MIRTTNVSHPEVLIILKYPAVSIPRDIAWAY